MGWFDGRPARGAVVCFSHSRADENEKFTALTVANVETMDGTTGCRARTVGDCIRTGQGFKRSGFDTRLYIQGFSGNIGISCKPS